MKKFVNDPKNFVPEMLNGIVLANPDSLRYVPEYNLIMRADAPRDDKVSIVQGSGSGHEPAHVMVVGRGMLDAACPGDVFAAPPDGLRLRDHQAAQLAQGRAPPDQQLHRRPDGLRHGPGDGRRRGDPGRDPDHRRRRLGQGLDLHRRPARRGRQLLRHQGRRRRRRGGRRAGRAGRPGHPRERRHPDHGHGPHRLHPAGQGLAPVRAGRRRDGDGRRHPRRARPPPREAGQRQRDHRRAAGGGGHRPALSGGRRGGADDQRPGRHPISELYILYGRAHAQLADRGITVRKNYVGEYCTSLDMAGASLTLVKLDDELVRLLEAPAEVAVRIF